MESEQNGQIIDASCEVIVRAAILFKHGGCSHAHPSIAAVESCVRRKREINERREKYWRYVIEEGHTLRAAARHFDRAEATIRQVVQRAGGFDPDSPTKPPSLYELRRRAALRRIAEARAQSATRPPP